MNNETEFLVIALGIMGCVADVAAVQQPVNGKAFLPSNFAKAPIAISGDNIYTAWWTNKTANNNEEVMFRASSDGGATFGDKINLSNTTNADSSRVEIAGEGENVIVSWWETNQTADTPVARVSTDAGQSFGPMLRLATNGTIGEAAADEEPEEGE